jgi:ATP-dependent DNA helicase RecQ
MADETEDAVAVLQRRQAREMFRLADDASCRHQALVRHFGERIAPCAASCDLCAGTDIVSEARPVKGGRASARRSTPQRYAQGERDRSAHPERSAGADSNGETSQDLELFEALRAIRKAIASEKALPAYCVFSDAVLRAMIELRPRDEVELAAVKGVGRKKAQQYGALFLPPLRRD